MTRYLVDTNVISATTPTSPVRRRDLVAWMDSHSSDLFLSAITIAEISDGIAKARREGARRKASDLSAWLRAVLHLYGERVLAFDSPTAEIAGALFDLARSRGHAPGFADIAIAATARRHELTILSHNKRHFVPVDVAAIDPFQELPPELESRGRQRCAKASGPPMAALSSDVEIRTMVTRRGTP